MIHAHHVTTYVKNELLDILFFTLFIVAVQVGAYRIFSYEVSSLLNASLLVIFVIWLFLKLLVRRYFFVFIVPANDYKKIELITQLIVFMMIVSVIILLSYLIVNIMVRLSGAWLEYRNIVLYSGIWLTFLIPTLPIEHILSSNKSNTISTWLKLSTPLLFIASFVFPMIYSPDPILILQFLILAGIIRLIIWLVILIDLQLLDLFSLTISRVSATIKQIRDLIYPTLGLYLMIIFLIGCTIYCLNVEQANLFIIGFTFFCMVPILLSELLGQWSLLLNNMIRLNRRNDILQYLRHINLWYLVLIFGIVPFLFLILSDGLNWLMQGIPENMPLTTIVLYFFVLALCGFLLGNPMSEILFYMNQKKEVLSVTSSTFVITVVSYVFFYSILDAEGIYISTLLGSFVLGLGVTILMKLVLLNDFEIIYPIKYIIKIIVSALISLIGGFLMEFIPNPIFHEIGWIFFTYFCLYTILIYYFGVLKTTKKSGFINWMRLLGNLH